MMLGEEAVVYGLREKREFNGRLCVVESDNGGAAQPRRWVLRVLPATRVPRRRRRRRRR